MKITNDSSRDWLGIQTSARRSKAADAYPTNVLTDLTPKQVVRLAKVVKEEFRDED